MIKISSLWNWDVTQLNNCSNIQMHLVAVLMTFRLPQSEKLNIGKIEYWGALTIGGGGHENQASDINYLPRKISQSNFTTLDLGRNGADSRKMVKAKSSVWLLTDTQTGVELQHHFQPLLHWLFVTFAGTILQSGSEAWYMIGLRSYK